MDDLVSDPITAEHETNALAAMYAEKSSPHMDLMREVERTNIAPWVEDAIRKDERLRVSQLLREGRDTLAGFAVDQERLVDLIAYMLTLNVDD